MYINKELKSLEKKGFIKTNLDPKTLKNFRKFKSKIKKHCSTMLKNTSFSFENFHKIPIEDIKLNNLRLSLIKSFSADNNLNETVYFSLKKLIDACVGPDIIVQKSCNLVIQRPNDINRSPFHKDAPANSNYEIVIWLPLVDCVGTMSMYMFDVENHERAKIFLRKQNSEKEIDKFCKKYGKLLNYKFGEVLIFWTNNYHYIPVNREKKTRWSLNLRFKNLFTPYGTKNLLDYYQILKTSPLTKLLNSIEKV